MSEEHTKRRSHAITSGVERTPNRAMLRAVGLKMLILKNRSSESQMLTAQSRLATPD